MSGGLEKAVLGVFDRGQMVYATRQLEGSLEIASCYGIVALAGEDEKTGLQAVLTDLEGRCAGGRLFSPAIAHGAEFAMARLGRNPEKRT